MERKVQVCGKIQAAVLALGIFIFGGASQANNLNFFGTDTNFSVPGDNSKPYGRSYFTLSTNPLASGDGAILTVDLYHGKLDSKVALTLQMVVDRGDGALFNVNLVSLDPGTADNKDSYHSRRQFTLKYADINERLEKILPTAAKNVRVGPGSPLFVYGYFMNYSHSWGSLDRGGVFFLPEDPAARGQARESVGVSNRRTAELDLAYPITKIMAARFVDPATQAGLKENGQIRSRLESEGKYQVATEELARIRKEMFELANDPAKAQAVFGSDWTMTAEMRYMRKDSSGNLLLDKEGLPIPDPMVDTYYDNKSYDAAKNDVAIRYRWTEGNATGSWNFKPGIGRPNSEGIVDRLEYGVDTTDDKPGTIKKFADSLDPMNPFRLLRRISRAEPSDFFQPSVKITDTRHKFKLQNKNGLVVEISVDDVLAESLRGSEKVRYGQVEMDIDHLATKSGNVARNAFGGTNFSVTVPSDAQLQATLAGLGDKAFLEGRPTMHTEADLEPDSPVKQKNQADFEMASKAIIALRDRVLGKSWVPGAQKYAFAAAELKLVRERQASASVKAVRARLEGKDGFDGRENGAPARGGSIANCGAAFN
jgi:hypothetical protein